MYQQTENLRTAKKNYHQNLSNEICNNPSSFWNAIKKIFQSKCKTNIKTNNSIIENFLVNIFLQLLIYLDTKS